MRLRPKLVLASALCALGLVGTQRALAQDAAPAADNEVPAAGSTPAPAQRMEFVVVPLVGGDTDVGIGGGAVGSIARPAPGDAAFRWRLEGSAFATVNRQGDALTSPFQDFYLVFTRKDLAGGRLRVEARAAYTRESNLRYFGLGNASTAPDDTVPERDLFTRVHPAARLHTELRLLGPLRLLLGSTFMLNRLQFEPDSKVLADLADGSPAVRDLLLVDREHLLNWLEAGLVYDSRDNEVAPARGQNHRLSVRASPWKTEALPYRYLGINATFSGYLPLGAQERTILAARLLGDVQLGDAPFYELSRVGESSAIGGPRFVRGPPSNRYYGKRKVLGNFEVRNSWFDFQVGRSKYLFGTSVFFDAGRVWADAVARPELDGQGLGLKYGTGGGLRVQKGKTFVLRVDLAWSPDARPLGAYFLAGHIF